MPIQRVTLFKVVQEANIKPMLELYRVLAESNSRDGKPYILSVRARPNLCPIERSNGYTFVAMTRFNTLDDVKYYDSQCEAHKRVKSGTRDLVQQPWEPPLTVYFEVE